MNNFDRRYEHDAPLDPKVREREFDIVIERIEHHLDELSWQELRKDDTTAIFFGIWRDGKVSVKLDSAP